MKKSSLMLVILGCACFLLLTTLIARAEDAESTVNQLNSELQQSGVITQDEANAIKSPIKDMVEKGASKEELKSIVTELSDKGVKGSDLKKSVNSMRDLVNAGEAPKEAGSVVSQAVAQAHEQGLRGKDLAAKVHEAIKQRKAQKDEVKKKAEKAKKEAAKEKKEITKAKKEGQEKAKKIEKETQQKGKKKGR